MDSYFILQELSGFGLIVHCGIEPDPSYWRSGVISLMIWTGVFLCCLGGFRLRPLSYSILPPEKKSWVIRSLVLLHLFLWCVGFRLGWRIACSVVSLWWFSLCLHASARFQRLPFPRFWLSFRPVSNRILKVPFGDCFGRTTSGLGGWVTF